MICVKGYIISITDYNDKEFIINILNENAFYSASLLKSKKSKNSSYQIFSYGEFTLYKGPMKYYKIKDFYLIHQLQSAYEDISRLLTIDFFDEILSKVLLNEKNIDYLNFYNLVDEINNEIEDLSIDNNYLILYFFYKMLCFIGLNPINTSFMINYKKYFLSLNNQNRIEKDDFYKIFTFFSELLQNYLGITLNSFKNFII